MHVLAIGGTRFVGRHTVAALLADGHDVTILHRGTTTSPFASPVREVLADRRHPTPEAVAVLGEGWDAVIDFCAYDTPDMAGTTSHLAAAGTYVLISTCRVYQRDGTHLDEAAAVLAPDDTDPDHTSALRKATCERYAARHIAATGGRLLVLRLGLTIGPHDPSGRLAYWLDRASQPGDFLVPMDDDQPVQLIDARDVAAFIAAAIRHPALDGVLNVAGPTVPAGHLVDLAATAAATAAKPQWVGEAFALRRGLRPWADIPLWLARSTPERSLMHIDTSGARRLGLRCRPLAITIADCLKERPRLQPGAGHLQRAHELRLLNEWRRSQ